MSLFEKLKQNVYEKHGIETQSNGDGVTVWKEFCFLIEEELEHLAKENVVLKAKLNHVEALLDVRR